jgi:hypothetical protein
VSSRIHAQTWSRDELFKFQPRLAEACDKGELNLKDEYPIVSIVKGMTFVLIELESLEALRRVTMSGSSLSSIGMGLDEGWSRTFVGTYFFVRTGGGPDGEQRLRTRMIEGKSCTPCVACQHAHCSSTSKKTPIVLPPLVACIPSQPVRGDTFVKPLRQTKIANTSEIRFSDIVRLRRS